jgi:hypothetical protein
MSTVKRGAREFARALADQLAFIRQDRSFSSVRLIGAMLLALALLVSAGANAQSFYVATNGNDGNPGTLSAPFGTFGRAQAAMRASGIKTVTIRGGTYSLAGSSLTFNPSDSGETWIPYPDETVVLDGGGSGYVWTNSANNLTIEGLTFQNLGRGVNDGSGMVVTGTGLTIRWNRFLNCYQDCLSGALASSLIDSNIFDGQSPGNPPNRQYSYAFSAIDLWASPHDNQISHNLIQNTQGGGVNLHAGDNTSMSNNVIDRNIIRNVNTNVTDSGAIYLIDTPHNGVANRIANNIIDGNGGTSYQTNITKAVYLDNYASNVLITGNVFRGVGTHAIQIHGGDHNWVMNNVFDLSGAANQWNGAQFLYQDYSPSLYGMTSNTFNMNLIYFSGSTPGQLWWFDLPGNAAFPYVVNNDYWSATGASVPTDPEPNPDFFDPLFANPPAGDYSIPANSLAYLRLNWTTLPTDQGPLPNPFVTQ